MTHEGPKHLEGKLCTLGAILQHNILVGSIKFLRFVHDDMQNRKIYRQLSLFGLKKQMFYRHCFMT